MNFNTLNLSEELLSEIKAVGYKEATPIQEKAIPAILEGRDVLGLANTGTGKTAAFLLPILNNLGKHSKSKGVRALILAPTRELAEQINSSLLQLGRLTGLKSVTVYGGISSKNQIDAIRRGVDIVVGCPGRVLDHINTKNLNLSKLETLVLDEADHMLDMGFLKDIEKIIKHTPKMRQTLFFSATMPSEIKELAEKVLVKPVTIETEYKEPVKLIEHSLHFVEQPEKKKYLFDLLEAKEMESLIIFMNSKHKAKNLAATLTGKGLPAVNFQGNLSQNQRDAALEGFRNNKFRILVATDIAARGLDIPQVTHVINFDLPRTAEAFTHRSGRTGRANKSGIVISFATSDDDKVLKDIKKINKTEFAEIVGAPPKKDEKKAKSNDRNPRNNSERSGNSENNITSKKPMNTSKSGTREKMVDGEKVKDTRGTDRRNAPKKEEKASEKTKRFYKGSTKKD